MGNLRKFFIMAFILFNLMAMVRVHLPLNTKFFSTIYKPVDSYLRFFSIFQKWDMFAKNPARKNVYLSADVEFNDGSKDTYFFPRTNELDFISNYTYGERYRKIVGKATTKHGHSFLWKDMARFALRKMKDNNFHKIPLKVHLNEHWNIIPDMEVEFVPHLTLSNKYKKNKIYTHEVL